MKTKKKKSNYAFVKAEFSSHMEGSPAVDIAVIKALGWKIDPNWMNMFRKKFSPSTDMNDAIGALNQIVTPLLDRDKKEFFTLDELGYRCCNKDKDGIHGKWRCSLSLAWKIKGKEPLIFVTANTPAMAVCKAILSAAKWLKGYKK